MPEQIDPIVIFIDGLKTISTLNAREHWAARSKRHKSQRQAVALALHNVERPALPCCVVLRRVAPRGITDDDNLVSSMKAVRDAVADWHGTDDGDPLWRWVVEQRKGKPKQYAVELEFGVVACEPGEIVSAEPPPAEPEPLPAEPLPAELVEPELPTPDAPPPAVDEPGADAELPPAELVEHDGQIHALWARRRGQLRAWCGLVLDDGTEVDDDGEQLIHCGACRRRLRHAAGLGRSRKTAIKRRELSKPAKSLLDRGLLRGRVLDFGCGHGDLVRFAELTTVEQFDPYWWPFEPVGKFDSIYCGYVANTIGPSARAILLQRIRFLLAPGGRGYVAVRRDIDGITHTATGTDQADVELDLPSVAHEPGSFEIYTVD